MGFQTHEIISEIKLFQFSIFILVVICSLFLWLEGRVVTKLKCLL